MKLSALILGILAVTSTGCTAKVVDLAKSGTGLGATTTAIAMHVRDLPSSAEAYPVLPVGQAVDPNALIVFFASEAQPCSEPVIPLPMDGTCPGSMWQLAVTVPAAKEAPGLVELSDPEIMTYQSAVDVMDDGDCDVFGAGASSYWPGTLDIVSLDSTSLSVELTNDVQVASPYHRVAIDGAYTVHRCDPATTGP